MAKRFNNKLLIIILVVLTGIFFITRMINQKRSSGTLKTDLVQIDSSLINTILLYPAAENGAEIIFNRNGNKWIAIKGDLSVEANMNGVQNMLSELVLLSPERLVTRDRGQWSDYGVDDSLGTRVIMKQGKKTVVDLMVGRFDYQPGPSGYGGYRGNYGSGLTYVRLSDEPEVYVVNGFLAMSFNQTFNNWRNQTFLNTNTSSLTSLKFEYPADSGFLILKVDTLWMIDDMQADSVFMVQYLNGIRRKSNNSFIDHFSPVIGPDYQLTIEGINMEPVVIKAYLTEENEFILNSSQNPEVYFSSPPTGLFESIFKSKSEFLNQGGL
ncbi:MAG: hypothetical protein AMS27_04865 [Bacteroides sp. SM23_62_1]|nr:MAG: hypothetical protein AMS27_04865 [Bacteroides sp. SM23_62_1]